MEELWSTFSSIVDRFYFPSIGIADVLDILIIAYILYNILLWIKSSRAWTLLKGVLIVGLFLLFAAVFHLNTILWIAKNLINVFLLALIILFQPELRRALDELGRKNIIKNLFDSDGTKTNAEGFNEKVIYELIRTCTELSRAKTGALIVIENQTPLGEFIDTGIKIDAVVSRQLLVNIFEKNTPLHDGAVIIRGKRVVAATCYLPLTERHDLNKDLGTRHRAGLGVSELTDSMTLIVSEETGQVSIAYKGSLYEDLGEDDIRKQLNQLLSIDNSSAKTAKTKKSKKLGEGGL